jgi:hypothetical protein
VKRILILGFLAGRLRCRGGAALAFEVREHQSSEDFGKLAVEM